MFFNLKDNKKEKEVNKKTSKDNFNEIVHSFEQNADIPNKVKDSLRYIVKMIDKINFTNVEEDSKLDCYLLKDIPNIIKQYLRIPKVQAVSMVMENNKTAKEVLVENIESYKNKIHILIEEFSNQQQENLLKIEKINEIKSEIKQDFFDII